MNFRRVILVSILFELVIIISALILFGFSLEALQMTTRYSGRFSLLIFSLLFYAQHKKLKWLSDKPYSVFAIVHGIHFIELASYVYLSGITLIPYRLLGGFIAYLLIFAMPVLHYRFTSHKISEKRFTIIENIFHLYIWIIFFITYLTRVLGKVPNAGNYFENLILFGWVIILLVFIKLPSWVTAMKTTSR